MKLRGARLVTGVRKAISSYFEPEAVVRWLLTLAIGYLAVALFYVGYRHASIFVEAPSDVQRSITGLILAAPLILLLLQQLTKAFSVRALGMELRITFVSEPVPDFFKLAYAETIAAPDQAPPQAPRSEFVDIRALFADQLRGLRGRVLQVDFGDKAYWWSTRLYLVAKLLDDFTEADHIAFVHRGGRFIGVASVRSFIACLERQHEGLEKRYCEYWIKNPSVAGIIDSWQDDYQKLGKEVEEKQVVDAHWLMAAMDAALETQGVEAPGPDARFHYQQILSRRTALVPIVENGRLRTILDVQDEIRGLLFQLVSKTA